MSNVTLFGIQDSQPDERDYIDPYFTHMEKKEKKYTPSIWTTS